MGEQEDSKEVLDLCWPLRLTGEQAQRLDEIAGEMRCDYVRMVEEMSEPCLKFLDWWVAAPSVRNTVGDRLFEQCCAVELAKELKRPVRVNSPGLAQVLMSLNLQVEFVQDPMQRSFIRRFGGLLWAIFFSIWSFWIVRRSRITESKQLANPNGSWILVDTFVTSGHEMRDRYYPGLKDASRDNQGRNEQVFFVPTFSGFDFTGLKEASARVRGGNQPYVFKEDFLKWRDVGHAVSHVFRMKNCPRGLAMFRGVDIDCLVKEQMQRSDMGSSMIALLNHRFFLRLKEQGIRVATTVDWFENQVIDRGWNSGVREYYPEARRVGYLGVYVSPHYLAMFPTDQEDRAGVLPEVLALPGWGRAKAIREFHPSMNVEAAPAFRFQGVWSGREVERQPKGCLLALHIDERQAVQTLDMAKAVAERLGDTVSWTIKPHPLMPKERVLAEWGELPPPTWQWVEGDFHEVLAGAEVFVGNASSTCLEAIACGVPACILANPEGLTWNPVPPEIPRELWRLCWTPEEATASLREFLERDQATREHHMKLAEDVRGEYFEPVTREGVARFLALGPEAG